MHSVLLSPSSQVRATGLEGKVVPYMRQIALREQDLVNYKSMGSKFGDINKQRHTCDFKDAKIQTQIKDSFNECLLHARYCVLRPSHSYFSFSS